MTAVLLAAATAALPPRAAFAQTAAPAAPPAASDPAHDVAAAVATLRSTDVDPQARLDAARALEAQHTPAARDAVLDQLKNNPAAQIPLALAISDDPAPDPAFIAPLFDLYGNEQARRAAAQALARYRDNAIQAPAVLQRLITLATSPGSEAHRQPAIRAVGQFDEQEAARALIELLSSPDPRVRDDAAAGLADMTGLRENRNDVRKWQDWWAMQAGKSPAQFKSDLRSVRADRYPQMVQRYNRLLTATQDALNAAYDAAPAPQREKLLMSYLDSEAPEIRDAGVRIVYVENNERRSVSPAIMDRVRQMVSDPSADVRVDAAQALYNDEKAAPALLAQLRKDPDDDVRLALIAALAPLQQKDPRITDEMLTLLRDPKTRVAQAAADAIGIAAESGAFPLNAPAEVHVRESLGAALDASASGNTNLRESIVNTMAALKDPALRQRFLDLLKGSEPTIQRAAIKGIGNLADPQLANILLNVGLGSPDRGVRLQAAQELAKVKAPELTDAIRNVMDNDPDPDVRKAAWADLKAWMPAMEPNRLAQLADEFKGHDVEKETSTRGALVDRFTRLAAASGDDPNKQRQYSDAAATQRQTLADLELNGGQPDKAAADYQTSLDYWKNNGGKLDVLNELSLGETKALLSAGRYEDATRFAEDAMNTYLKGQDPSAVAGAIKNEADRLSRSSDPADFDKFARLYTAISKMETKLPPEYLNQIDDDNTAMLRAKDLYERTHSKPAPTTTGAG